MPDYKQMYLTLFRKVTSSIEILQEAQCEAEELYIASGEQKEAQLQEPAAADIPVNIDPAAH